MRGRFDNLNHILTLDPQRDHQEIVRLVGMYEYPWMLRKSLEFALFRTYAVPSIGAILDQSGQFLRRGQKRYDDTAIIIGEMSEHGYDSERGNQALQRMNTLHRRWNISNEDYLYVLSAFVFIPIYWHNEFGWRTPTRHENLASFYYWREVGQRMGIQNIPATYEALEEFHQRYEAEQFRYNEASARVAEQTVQIFLSWYPFFIRPLVRQALYTFMDDRLRGAFGFPPPSRILKWITHSGLKLMSAFVRYLRPPRKVPYSVSTAPNLTYPRGYEIDKIGADH